MSGGALALTSGMSGTIAQTTVFANGVLLTVPAGTFTLANGNTQPRYDVLYVQLGATGGSNPTSGNTTTADSGTFGVQPGTPGSSPVKPTLTNANYCQIGSIYVPANATSLTTGNLNSQDVSPNANGPLPAFSGVQSHIQAAITSSNAVHNIKQGSGNAFDADTVDGLHAAAFDVAGAAAVVSASLATETTNRATADSTLQTNINNEATTRQTSLTGHANQSIYSQVTHGEESRRGHVTGIAITSGMGQVQVATITFSPAMAGPPQSISLTMDAPNPGGAPPYAPPGAITTSGFQIWMSTAGTYNGGVYWRADS